MDALSLPEIIQGNKKDLIFSVKETIKIYRQVTSKSACYMACFNDYYSLYEINKNSKIVRPGKLRQVIDLEEAFTYELKLVLDMLFAEIKFNLGMTNEVFYEWYWVNRDQNYKPIFEKGNLIITKLYNYNTRVEKYYCEEAGCLFGEETFQSIKKQFEETND